MLLRTYNCNVAKLTHSRFIYKRLTRKDWISTPLVWCTSNLVNDNTVIGFKGRPCHVNFSKTTHRRYYLRCTVGRYLLEKTPSVIPRHRQSCRRRSWVVCKSEVAPHQPLSYLQQLFVLYYRQRALVTAILCKWRSAQPFSSGSRDYFN